jgi:hypothetical protein
MDLSTLIVLVTGFALYALWRSRELRLGQVLIAGLLGFALADSGLAPDITEGVSNIVEWVSTWHI